MKKLLTQGVLMAGMFAAIWFGLSQIDFMRLFEVEDASVNTEQKIGELIWESIQRTENVVKNDSVEKSVRKIIDRISSHNDIDGSRIKLHIIREDDVNAFAMPDNHMVVFTGLIADCENESELAGVIGHEIAHMEKKHVMRKLVREIGLSVLLSATTGGGNGQTIREAVRHLSASAYDRSLESEADRESVNYLLNANIDPAPFADLMYRLATDSFPDAFYWISSHPESEERAREIVAYFKGRKNNPKPVLSAEEWKFLKKFAQD